MTHTCRQCSAPFEITPDDLDFYDRVSPVLAGQKYLIPPPTLCPDCRMQRRLAHRNERKLYHRRCDKTGKQIISVHAQDRSLVVYGKDEWWADGWSAMDYGRSVDFSRPFFDQIAELQRAVPRMSLQQEHNENSDYTHNVSHLKKCYLLFSADFSQDCLYGIWVERSRTCVDTFCIDECERAYESVFCQKLYNTCFAYMSSQCSDCAFIYDCRGCKNCFLCYGLRNKQYCIANAQYTKEDYEKKMKELPLSSARSVESAKGQFKKLLEKAPRPAMCKHGNIIDCTGDLLQNCGNCRNCFELREGRDCVNTIGFKATDARDCSYVMGEFGYENCECFPVPQHSAFNINCYTGADLYYCDLCMLNCRNCFGCVGLKRAQYCILNKQYTKEEYEELIPKIIEHMRNDGAAMNPSPSATLGTASASGSWGEFFPVRLSIYRYNETEAQDYYPLQKEEALKRGWTWEDNDEGAEQYSGPAVEIPDDIKDVPDNICKAILRCTVTGRPYKIIPQELNFYRDMNISVPRTCPDQRHKERMMHRNPRHLWKRSCAKCGKQIETTYAPDRPETVYCEECYLHIVL